MATKTRKTKKTDTDSTAVSVPPPAAPPAVVHHAPRGLEEVDQEDLVIPRFSIVQPTSKEGNPGYFRDNINGEEQEFLEGLVPLKFRKGRVFFLKPEDGGGLKCASDDRVRPAARIDDPVSERCAGCPAGAWRTEGGKRIKPDCSETWTLLAAYDHVPYFLTFKSSAMRAVKRLLTQLKLQAQKQRRDLCGFQFDVRLELETFDVGKAYLPVFEKLRLVPVAQYADYQSLYDAFSHAEPVFEDASDEAPVSARGTSFDFGANAGDDEGPESDD